MIIAVMVKRKVLCMGINSKGKRKITYNDQLYVWHVSLDDESPYYILNIVSEDKKLILACPLGVDRNYVISKGTIFQGQKTSGRWQRYLCPVVFPEVITPKIVANIIRWAVDENDGVEVSNDGVEIVV